MDSLLDREYMWGGVVVTLIDFLFIESALISRCEKDLQLHDFCD